MGDQDKMGKKSGVGRGSYLLEMLRKNAEESSKSTSQILSSMESTSQSHTPGAIPSSMETTSESRKPSAGRGRAALLGFLKTEKPAERSTEKPVGKSVEKSVLSAPSPPVVSQGRATLLSIIKQAYASGSHTSASAIQDTVMSPVETNIPYDISKLSVRDSKSISTAISQESKPICRPGTCGTKINMTANYINLKIEPGKGLFQYEVKYHPDIDSRVIRRKLLNQHSAALGHTKTFDGMILYLPRKLPQDVTTFQSEHPNDGSSIVLKLIYKKQQSLSENIQFFNILLGRVMRALNLVRIGRQSYNPKASRSVPQHRIEVWPGYITAINEYEGGLKLCIDARHRIMHTETIRDIITDIFRKSPQKFKESVMAEIIGKSVITRYNNKTYRIDDIAWDKNPKFVFEGQNGETSLIDYYQHHWNEIIKDTEQPLLVHRAKNKTATGETQEKYILLVPELCYITGFTDNILSDFRIMKDLDVITKLNPNDRQDVIRRFLREVQQNTVTRDILAEWGLQIENDTLNFTGRVLDPELILFGNNKSFLPRPDKPADWNAVVAKNPVLRTPNLRNWYILFCSKDARCANEFVDMLLKVSTTMNMKINHPQKITLKDDRTESYLRELRRHIDRKVELMVVIFPSNRMDRYSAVKKLCCVEMPIASQAIISRTISRGDKLKSVTEKIALQINCKLGGALWALKIPFENCMVCGIDVYHAGADDIRKGSVAGFVASLDNMLTSWYGKSCLQGPHQELIDLLQVCLVSAINEYRKRNGRHPDRIIVYRDGVGDGQLEVVLKYEVKQLLATFSNIDPNYRPQFSVIVVQKRINTRLFCKNRTGLCNPQPGTVVDSEITRRNYYDFFLVSQNVRHGTVMPTHYIVAYDATKMKPDDIQRFTYKLCHLYYNWPGTVRVPAPCLYAHKLVYLVGQSIRMEPHQSLSSVLYYL